MRRSRSDSAAPRRARMPAGRARPGRAPAPARAGPSLRGRRYPWYPQCIFSRTDGTLLGRPSASFYRMNLHRLLQARAARKEPVRVVLIGAGKFGSMYLSQAQRTPGLQILAVADLAPDRARASLARVGWSPERFSAASLDAARSDGTTFVTDDAMRAIAHPATEVVIDSTGSPAAGIAHALACCRYAKHIVMVNVEADALAGPLLAQRAREAGIVYSLAYGDQPPPICELVDWARPAGFEVIAAGKGTKYLPAYHDSTPDTVWGHYGFTPEAVAR